MRTTLTIDEDVAAAIRRRQLERGTRFKEEVNDLLRAGLTAAPAAPDAYELPAVTVGRVLVRDPQAWKDMLDDEDDARSLSRRR